MSKNMWESCVEFHGHECPGLKIGYRAALYAKKLLSCDCDCGCTCGQDLICVSENDACGVDAIQVILGCNAISFHLTGKKAYSFYDLYSKESVRLIVKPGIISELAKADEIEKVLALPDEEIFDVLKTKVPMPAVENLYAMMPCDCCHEETEEVWLEKEDERLLCPDCIGGICHGAH